VAQAVQDRNQVALKQLLRQKADVNAPAADGTTAIHWAAHWNDVASAKLLIAAGAKVDAANRYGATALWMAASGGSPEMIELLLKAGANPNKAALRGEPPLHAAARTGSVRAVKALVAAGADVNAKEPWRGQTALMWAAGDYEQHPDVVQTLLELGAKVDERTGEVDLSDPTGHQGGQKEKTEAPKNEALKPLVAAKPAAESKPAAEAKPSSDAKPAAESKAGGEEKAAAEAPAPRGGRGAAAPSSGLTALAFAVRENNIPVVKLLIKAGANVNDNKLPNGMSPLMMAITNQDDELALLLLDNGANPKIANGAGFTPLHTLMQKRGAAGRGGDGGRGEKGGVAGDAVLRALLAKGADPNAKLPARRQPPNFEPISYPPIMGVQYATATPLWIAANNADLEGMRILVEAGAKPNENAIGGTTPLMVAAGLGYGLNGPTSRLGKRREDTEDNVLACVKQLLEWGNDINAVNENGQTAIYGATMSVMPRVIEFLVQKGAETTLNKKDKDGRTPLQVADDNRTDKYRTNQSLDPKRLEPTYQMLKKLGGTT
jgi:ankyrin repeat protein